MIDVITATQDDDLMKDLSACLDNCKDCNLVVHLKQFMQKYGDEEGKLNSMTVDKYVGHSINTILINGNFIYLTIDTQRDLLPLNKIKSMWHTLIERGHKRYMAGEDNDYALIIDLIGQQENDVMAYSISFLNPIFLTLDDGKMEIAFAMNDMRFEVAEIDLVRIDDEIRYELEVERTNGGYGVHNNQNDDLLNNDDILSNEEILSSYNNNEDDDDEDDYLE